jgi:tight adherence protein B
MSAASGAIGALLASRILGPAGLVAGAIGGGVLPRAVRRSRTARHAVRLEQQLAEAVDAAALAVRSGLSISQALAFASEESAEPLAHHLRRLFEELEVGWGLEEALGDLATSVGGEDVALFVVVVSIHLRSGGNLAGALEQVSATIRHRLAVRRELRALTAQGRISGAVLGILPLLFLLFLGATSQHDLGPVYRSPVGVIMVSTGLAMEGVAYLWVRRILRVRS